MTARERCARWVQAHSSDRDGFYSPSVPPMEIEGLIPFSPPSDGSSHSLPPKMVLRYSDGRPDIPIPHVTPSLRRHDRYPRSPLTEPPYHRRSHTTASGQSHPRQMSPVTIHSAHQPGYGCTSYHPHPEPIGADADSPEEIRVLPSQAPVPSPLPPRSVSSSHHQSSHHYLLESFSQTEPNRFYEDHSLSRPIVYSSPSSHHFNATPQINPQERPAPWHGLHAHSSGSSTKHSHAISNHKVPPSIVYAPHHGPSYPPAILYYPPTPPRDPNGMIYSCSAPVPIQGGSYPSPVPPDGVEDRRRRGMHSSGPGRMHRVPRSDDGRGSDAESVSSESTYYVLPSPGRKVHAIAPSPGQSIRTATSTTKSPGQSPRKSFLQRIFNFKNIRSSTGGSTQGPRNKLQRRHSTGDSERLTPD